MKKNCNHKHQCNDCVREEIAKIDSKIRKLHEERAALQGKLPDTYRIINICTRGCGHWPCNHYYLGYYNSIQNLPYTQIATTNSTVAFQMGSLDNQLNSSTNC